MFKSNKGFTLVELIVVIAILAILAGVAIPVYNGYIKRAQDAAVVTELDAIQTAAQAANATSGEIVKIIVDSTGIKVAGNSDKLASGFNSDFALFYPDATGKYGEALGVFTSVVELKGSYENGATWVNGEWKKGVEGTINTQTAGSSISGVTDSNTNNSGTNTGTTTTHNWDNGTVTTAATCTTDGVMTYTCTDDGCTETKTETIAATDHTWVADGDNYKCTNENCGKIITKSNYEAGIY